MKCEIPNAIQSNAIKPFYKAPQKKCLDQLNQLSLSLLKAWIAQEDVVLRIYCHLSSSTWVTSVSLFVMCQHPENSRWARTSRPFKSIFFQTAILESFRCWFFRLEFWSARTWKRWTSQGPQVRADITYFYFKMLSINGSHESNLYSFEIVSMFMRK